MVVVLLVGVSEVLRFFGGSGVVNVGAFLWLRGGEWNDTPRASREGAKDGKGGEGKARVWGFGGLECLFFMRGL